MMNKRLIILLAIACIGVSPTIAQDWRADFDKMKGGNRGAYDQFKKDAHKEYKAFRDSAFNEYRKFVREAWAQVKGEPPKEVPVEEKVVPILTKSLDAETNSWFSNLFKRNKNKKAKQGKLKTVVGNGEEIAHQKVLMPEPIHEQPQPEFRVEEANVEPNDKRTFRLFGTDYRVRIGENCRPTLKGLKPDEVDNAMSVLNGSQFDDLLYDCLQERQNHHLSDWAYYQMLQAIADQFYGKHSNEGSLILAYLLANSGYKVRMACDDTHLYMLAASRHYIYGKSYGYYEDGDSYYLLDGRQLPEVIYLCKAHYKKEGAVSLQMSAEQDFSPNPTPERTITSRENEDFSFTITSNKNYMDFYEVYPCSTIDNNFMTCWVMYAETPLEKGVREQLYPAMREKLKGLTQAEQVQQILWWIQTGLKYEYDEKLWGGDRAFFGEESLFYPYCDCEDRAILLSHFVRDLVGLDVALVYYPGHLAAAVAFTDEVKGNYYMHQGRKFTVCDPTIIPGEVGEVMEPYTDTPATLMLLRRK